MTELNSPDLVSAIMALSENVAKNTRSIRGLRRNFQSQESQDKDPERLSTGDFEDDAIRKDKVKIMVSCVLSKMGDINTAKQTFQCEASILATYEEPALINKIYCKEDIKNINWTKYWDPLLFVLNCEKEYSNVIVRDVKYDGTSNKVPVVHHLIKIKGNFWEKMELKNFPVDIQNITLKLTSERLEDEIEFIEDENISSTIVTKNFVDFQEWDLYDYLDLKVKDSLLGGKTKYHPILNITCYVARKSGYFFWNFVSVMMLIMLIPIVTLCIPSELPHRIVVGVTLLLTVIMLKANVSKNIPTISYLTYLEFYMLCGIAYLILSICLNAVSSEFFANGSHAYWFDVASLLILIVSVTILHVYFGCVFVRKIKPERIEIQKRVAKHNEMYYSNGQRRLKIPDIRIQPATE